MVDPIFWFLSRKQIRPCTCSQNVAGPGGSTAISAVPAAVPRLSSSSLHKCRSRLLSLGRAGSTLAETVGAALQWPYISGKAQRPARSQPHSLLPGDQRPCLHSWPFPPCWALPAAAVVVTLAFGGRERKLLDMDDVWAAAAAAAAHCSESRTCSCHFCPRLRPPQLLTARANEVVENSDLHCYGGGSGGCGGGSKMNSFHCSLQCRQARLTLSCEGK